MKPPTYSTYYVDSTYSLCRPLVPAGSGSQTGSFRSDIIKVIPLIIKMAEVDESKYKFRSASKNVLHVKDFVQVFVEDMQEEWAKDAQKTARDAFSLPVPSNGNLHAFVADYIRKKFDKEHECGWNCIVGKSFGAYVTHEIKTYSYFSVVPGVYILLWRS